MSSTPEGVPDPQSDLYRNAPSVRTGLPVLPLTSAHYLLFGQREDPSEPLLAPIYHVRHVAMGKVKRERLWIDAVQIEKREEESKR